MCVCVCVCIFFGDDQPYSLEWALWYLLPPKLIILLIYLSSPRTGGNVLCIANRLHDSDAI